MAETWKVQLNDEEAHGGGVYCGGSVATACTNNTGKFNFASPSTGVNNYTITYTNGTQTTTTSFTVNAGDCVKCDCDKIEFTATEVNGQGGDGVQLGTFRVTSEFCKNAFTVTASAVSGGFVTNPRISGNKVLGNVGVNEGAPRNLKFNLLINNNTCLQTTTQKTGCNCNSITHTPVSTVTSFDGKGFTGKVATYSVSTGCDINKVGIQGDTNVYSLTTEGSTHIVKASVDENPGSSERQFSYKLTYNNSQCDGKGRTITQGIACDCENFKFTTEGGTIYIPASGGCNVNLGSIQGETCKSSYKYIGHSTTNNNFIDDETPPNIIDPVTGYEGGNLKGLIYQNNGRNKVLRSCDVTVSVEIQSLPGVTCTSEPFKIMQYASMTDNDSAMDGACKVHALKIDATGTRGGNDEVFMLGNNPDINWRDYFEYKANTPFEGQSAAPTGVKDQQGSTISSFDTSAITSINEPYFENGQWHLQFDLSEHSGTKRYAVVYLHNKKFGTPGNIYQEYGWIIAGQPMRD